MLTQPKQADEKKKKNASQPRCPEKHTVCSYQPTLVHYGLRESRKREESPPVAL